MNVFVTTVCDNRWKWAGEVAVSDVCLRQQGREDKNIYILIQAMAHNLYLYLQFLFVCIFDAFVFCSCICIYGRTLYIAIKALVHNCNYVYLWFICFMYLLLVFLFVICICICVYGSKKGRTRTYISWYQLWLKSQILLNIKIIEIKILFLERYVTISTWFDIHHICPR